MKIRPLIRGIISYIPGLLSLFQKGKGAKGTGGTISARYCYAVWLRHLIYLHENTVNPLIIAELGPGDSLGIGLAALLTGGQKYYALDIIEHANVDQNLKVFEELIYLFKNKVAVPDPTEFPLIHPPLENYDFPEHILSDERLNHLLSKERLESIKEALVKGSSNGMEIKYIVPWYDIPEQIKGSVDLVFSQAVLEHILNLQTTYQKMHEWLKPGGIISHEIDYSAHETHTIWNGHWEYNSSLWKIIMHGRKYGINRLPHSYHINRILKTGFQIIKEIKNYDTSGYGKKFFQRKLDDFEEEDFIIRSAFIQAKKI